MFEDLRNAAREGQIVEMQHMQKLNDLNKPKSSDAQ